VRVAWGLLLLSPLLVLAVKFSVALYRPYPSSSLIPCYSIEREGDSEAIWRRSRRRSSLPPAPAGRGEPCGRCVVYIPLSYYLGLGRLGFRLPAAMVAPGYCHLIFVSGLGVGFSTLLGGDLEVFFCFLLGESKCGAGLVVVVGARFVRLVYSSLLAIGVDKIQVGGIAGDGGSCLLRAPIGVEMLLFPFGGLKLQVVGSAGDGGCFFWAGSFGSEGARSRLFLLLRAPTLKLLMFF
jgi:hypothetical protein